MLGAGTGSELRRPLGFAVVGGLLVSQILTLFTHAGGVSLSRPAEPWFQGGRGTAAGPHAASHPAWRRVRRPPAEPATGTGRRAAE